MVSEKVPVALRPWMMHVEKVKKANPKMVYSDVLEKASDSYTKKAPAKKGKGFLGDLVRVAAPVVGSLADLAGKRKKPAPKKAKKGKGFLGDLVRTAAPLVGSLADLAGSRGGKKH